VQRSILGLSALFASLVLVTSCGQITVTITSPLNGQTVRAEDGVVVQVRTAGDNGALSFSCQLDGGPVTFCTPTGAPGSSLRQLRITPISDGLHTFTIRAIDTAGATGTASVSFLADIPLRVAIASPRDLERLTSDTPAVVFSASGATGAVSSTCRVDTGPERPCTSPHPLPDIADGPHQITVTARDASGAISSVSVPFLLDTGAWPVPVPVADVSGGTSHTCALLANAKVRCWGDNSFGQLGYANRLTIGDDEFPSTAGDVNVGGAVTQIAAGSSGHTCALLQTGGVLCWGFAGSAALGYGRTVPLTQEPASAGDVEVGAPAIQIAAGFRHTCAVLASGTVRCWGENANGELGHAHTTAIGDDEVPASAGDVNVGGAVRQISLGARHTCALLANGKVRCWGSNGAGQLGYGHGLTIGDDEAPASAGDVNVGGDVVQVAAGGAHTCALLTTGTVRCWGQAWSGQLGYASPENVGDDEAPASAGDVAVGGRVVQLSAGAEHTCVRLHDGAVRCWGSGNRAQLGYGNLSSIGDDELPASAGDVSVGGPAARIVAGSGHTCAVLAHGGVRCWGAVAFSASGPQPAAVLGYPRRDPVGDDESPSSAGDVLVGF
jgi:alpha-tubulin suppressor-like RCC1 family protein